MAYYFARTIEASFPEAVAPKRHSLRMALAFSARSMSPPSIRSPRCRQWKTFFSAK